MAMNFNGHIALGREATYGTPVAPTDYARFQTARVEVRQGEAILDNSGNRSEEAAVFTTLSVRPQATIEVRPDDIGLFLLGLTGRVASIGTDSGAGGSTLNGATSAGATSIILNDATGYTVGEYIQVGTGLTAEVRQISAIAVNTLTLNVGLLIAHANAEVCNEVTTPVTHTFQPQDTLHSFTWEQRLGTFTAKGQRVHGAKINTMNFAWETGLLTAEINAVAEDVDDTAPTAASLSTLDPYIFHQATVTYDGGVVQVKRGNISLDNRLVDDEYVTGSRRLADIEAGGLMVNGELQLVFEDLTQVAKFWGANAATTPAATPTFRTLNIKFDDGTRYIEFILPKVLLTQGDITTERKSQITQTLAFKALYDTATAKLLSIDLKNARQYYA